MTIDEKPDWQRLSPLLDELLALAQGDRAARLARLRDGDAALADALGALLAQQSVIEREGFLAGSALGDTEPTLAGRTIGAYTLLRPLGAGGMGSVWLARRSDGRYEGSVAVKLLNLALLGRGGAERFAREGNVLARLTHPNIARLLDAGVSDDGQPYLVLEHVEGEPIDAWCESRGLGIEARVTLMQGVLGAVAHAHAKLVLHRDLKPSNILVARDGSVKLLDFGIAKLLDADTASAQATELTQLAGRAFTPDYAAPEQVEGGEVTTATDVYALGVLLFVLLGGGHPTVRAQHTPLERLRAVVEDEPPRLSDAAAHTGIAMRGRRGLLRDLDNIVAKALKKSPAERYASADALADDLRRCLADEPVSARADSLGYRAAKFVRRHRLAVGAASLTAAALVAATVVTAWQAASARRERDEALHQAERASARTGLMSLVLGAAGGPDQPITQRQILDRSVALVDKQFARDPRIAIDLLYPIAGQYYTIGDSEKDIAVMRRAAELARATGDPQLIGHVACNTVAAELGRGRVDAAREQMQAGMAMLSRVRAPSFQSQIECMRSQAELALAEGDVERAARHAADAVARCERDGNTTGGLYSSVLSLLAGLHEQRGALAASYEVTERLQRWYDKMGLDDSLNALVNRRRQAGILMAWGDDAAAQSIVDAIAARLGGDDAPPWLDAVRGQLLARAGDLAAAEAVLRTAAARARTRGNAMNAAPVEFALARVLIEQRRFDEGERLLDSVERELPAVAGRITPATLRASAKVARGDAAAAHALIDAELRRLGSADTVARAAALRVAAQVHAADGDAMQSLRTAHEALAVAERIARDPERSGDVRDARRLLALARHAVEVAPLAAAARDEPDAPVVRTIAVAARP